jgi:predicted amidophosphoribosyltransferase
VNGLARAAARFFLPSVCLSCRVRRADDLFRGGVCGDCWDALPVPEAARCSRCDEALPGAADPARCGRCLLDPPDFERLRAAAAYRGSARRILLAFKFQGADYLGPRLAAVIAQRLGRPEADEIAAVPATPRARRARGYQPSEALAAALALRLDLPFAAERLVKVRETEIQSRLPAARRAGNVRGAFQVRGTPRRRVLLVDDVATSAATARECARQLALAGAGAVTVWCFARASRTDIDPEAP